MIILSLMMIILSLLMILIRSLRMIILSLRMILLDPFFASGSLQAGEQYGHPYCAERLI